MLILKVKPTASCTLEREREREKIRVRRVTFLGAAGGKGWAAVADMLKIHCTRVCLKSSEGK